MPSTVIMLCSFCPFFTVVDSEHCTLPYQELFHAHCGPAVSYLLERMREPRLPADLGSCPGALSLGWVVT